MTEENDKEIVIERIFKVRRESVWKAWTEKELIERWFGPKGFDTRVEKNDLKPGGRTRYVMVGPDGKEYPAEGTVKKIVEYEKIVSTDEFGEDYDPKGADLPQGMLVTATFEELGKKTKLIISIVHPTVEDKKKHEKMGVVAGWNSSLDKLAELLEERK